MHRLVLTSRMGLPGQGATSTIQPEDLHTDRRQSSPLRVLGPQFRVHCSGFRVQGSRVRVQGSGFRVQGFTVSGSGFRVPQASGFWPRAFRLSLLVFRVQKAGVRGQGSGSRAQRAQRSGVRSQSSEHRGVSGGLRKEGFATSDAAGAGGGEAQEQLCAEHDAAVPRNAAPRRVPLLLRLRAGPHFAVVCKLMSKASHRWLCFSGLELFFCFVSNGLSRQSESTARLCRDNPGRTC
eukprot:3932120-Rhodomonas_salina.2